MTQPARIRFRAAGQLGWATFDPHASELLEIEHPSEEVQVAVRRHFKAQATFITPVKPPPHLAGVLDYCDELKGTGLDSLDYFLRRANELAGGLVDRYPDATVLWPESEVPDEDEEAGPAGHEQQQGELP